VPVAAETALQGLRDKGQLRAGQKVLINGASGGIGTFAVQIAKALGAEVTGVCRTRNVELVRSLGADRVVDYTREDFTRAAGRYDVLLDNAGNRSRSECRRVLAPNGTIVLAGQSARETPSVLPLLTAGFVSRFMRGQRLVSFISNHRKEDLLFLKELMEAGKVTSVIDRTYPLRDVPEAIRYVGTGHARAKVVITME
jgi:NADPH:quinone reductase-like Zn-dependent oxidoreductase